MIELCDLSLRAGNFALDRLSAVVPAGRYAVLMGKTGRGKTTLLEAICGLRPARGGRVLLCGRDVTRLRPADRGVGYVPQDLALFPTLSVQEHLEFALRVRRAAAAVIAERVREMSRLLGIEHLLGRRIQGLSGGEAQRVALGRALSFHPPVLLLDEPLSALDEETRAEMYALLRTVQARTGVTALHVTHSRSEARALADHLLLLEGGQLRQAPLSELGPPIEAAPLPPGGKG